MKSFIIIFVLIVSSECGLLDDLVVSKDQKPKSAKERNQGALIKVRQTLENGTKIFIDALGNIIKNPPKESEENTNSNSTLEAPKKDNEIVKEDEPGKPIDPKADLPNSSTEKVKITTPKVDENPNKTLPTEPNPKTKDAANKMVNTTDTSQTDENTGKNCTSADGKACGNVKLDTRTFLKGDECPTGKGRADDGTCVDEL